MVEGGVEIRGVRLPSMTLGWKPAPWARRRSSGSRAADDLEGAGAMRQAADEAALVERRDQPVDAGLGLQVERLLHLVEGRRHACFLHALVDEEQQLFLLCGQHQASWCSAGGALFPGCLDKA